MIDSGISSRLKEARQAAGLSQKQAARLLKMSDGQQVSEIETGKRVLRRGQLNKFAEIYCVSLDWLVGIRTDENVSSEWRELVEKCEALSNSERIDLIRVLAMRGE